MITLTTLSTRVIVSDSTNLLILLEIYPLHHDLCFQLLCFLSFLLALVYSQACIKSINQLFIAFCCHTKIINFESLQLTCLIFIFHMDWFDY